MPSQTRKRTTRKFKRRSRSCARLHTSKYVSRKSPPYSANAPNCRGTKKMGNDGTMYLSKKSGKAKSFRWVKQVKS